MAGSKNTMGADGVTQRPRRIADHRASNDLDLTVESLGAIRPDVFESSANDPCLTWFQRPMWEDVEGICSATQLGEVRKS